MKILVPLLTAVLAASPAWADVVLPSILSDHAVVQKSAKTRIWGKADPGEEIAVTLDAATAKTVAGPDGKWTAELNLSESKPGPFELVVQGKNRIAVADVVVGEVWIASGQSNMEMPVKGWGNIIDADAEIAASANPLLRQFLVKKASSFEPADECKGEWAVAGPEQTAKFTAAGYFFGKKLQRELQAPVGLINSTWGGTPIEAWISPEALATVADLKQPTDRRIAEFNAYPEKKAAFVAAFAQWTAANGREDKPTPDTAAFADPGISTQGWTRIQLPGPVAGEGLPAGGGVYWLRKEISLDPKQVGQQLNLSLGTMEGFEAIYWNGKFIKETTYKDIQGQNAGRSCQVPADQVKQTGNVIVVRIYDPAGSPKFTNGGSLRAGPLWIGGEWLAKAETAFPELPQAEAATVPQVLPGRTAQQYIGSTLFNSMIAPLLPYSIRGAIWYQGESNAGRAWQYRTAFPLLINDWRAQWKQGDFPFYFCQLANYMGKTNQPGEANWAELREAQGEALKLPHTGQAVLIDLGESDDIHPRNKKDVGERLAAIALANDYGKAVSFSGPVFQSVKIENGKARVSFDRLEGGLVARPVPATFVKKSLQNEIAPIVRNSPHSELEGFAICGEDKKWVWADAKIDGDTVLVWSEKVPAPVAVRYGWASNPTCNLYNKAGFPASPFRTDNFPASTLNVKY